MKEYFDMPMIYLISFLLVTVVAFVIVLNFQELKVLFLETFQRFLK